MEEMPLLLQKCSHQGSWLNTAVGMFRLYSALSAQRMIAPYQEHQETVMLAALYLDRGLMLPAKSMQSNSKCMQHF